MFLKRDYDIIRHNLYRQISSSRSSRERWEEALTITDLDPRDVADYLHAIGVCVARESELQADLDFFERMRPTA
jgi:hypothetical protein